MILDCNNQPIDPLWLAEFRGFFYGEGFLGIVSWGLHKKSGYKKLLVRGQITSRSDDIEMLNDICSKLGGFVYEEGKGRTSKGKKGEIYQSAPYSVWRITKADDIARLCDILEDGLMPSKKRSEVPIIREFLKTVLEPGKRLTLEIRQKRHELHESIKAMHQYSDC